MSLILRFSGDGLGVASKVIQWATWSWCSHVEFEAPDGRLFGAIPGGGTSYRSVPKVPERRVERYRVIGGEKFEDAVWKNALSQEKCPYDWTGVIGFGMHRDWAEEGDWFCSELVAWAYQVAGYPLLRADHAWRVSPRDLLMSPLLEEV